MLFALGIERPNAQQAGAQILRLAHAQRLLVDPGTKTAAAVEQLIVVRVCDGADGRNTVNQQAD